MVESQTKKWHEQLLSEAAEQEPALLEEPDEEAAALAAYDRILAAPEEQAPEPQTDGADARAMAEYERIVGGGVAAEQELVLPHELTDPDEDDLPDLIGEAATIAADALVPGFKVARGIRSGIGMMRTALGEVPVEEALPDFGLRRLDDDYTESMRRNKSARPTKETLQQLIFAAESGVQADQVNDDFYMRWREIDGEDDFEHQSRIDSGKYKATYKPAKPGISPEVVSVEDAKTGERFDPNNMDPDYRARWGIGRSGWTNIDLTPQRLEHAAERANDASLVHALTRDKAMERLNKTPASQRWSISVENDPWNLSSWIAETPNPYDMTEPHLVASHNMAGLARYIQAASFSGHSNARGMTASSVADAIKAHAKKTAKAQSATEMEPWYKEYLKKRQEEGFFGALIDRPWEVAPYAARGLYEIGAALAMGARYAYRTSEPVLAWWLDPRSVPTDLPGALEISGGRAWGGIKTFSAGMYHVAGAVAEWARHSTGYESSMEDIRKDMAAKQGVPYEPPEEYLGSAGAFLFEHPVDLAGLFSVGGMALRGSALRAAKEIATTKSAIIDVRIEALTKSIAEPKAAGGPAHAEIARLSAVSEQLNVMSRSMELSARVGDALSKYADPFQVLILAGSRLPKYVVRRIANRDYVLGSIKVIDADGNATNLLEMLNEYEAKLQEKKLDVERKGTKEVIPEDVTRGDFMERVQDMLSAAPGSGRPILWLEMPDRELINMMPEIPEPDIKSIMGRELTEEEASSIRNTATAVHGAMSECVGLQLETLEITRGDVLRGFFGDPKRYKGLTEAERSWLIDKADEIDPLRETSVAGSLAAAEQTSAINQMRPLMAERRKMIAARPSTLGSAEKAARSKGLDVNEQNLAKGLLTDMSYFAPEWAPRRIGSVTLEEFDKFAGGIYERINSLKLETPRRKKLAKDVKRKLRAILKADRKLIAIEERIGELLGEQRVKAGVLEPGKVDVAHIRRVAEETSMSINEKEMVKSLIDEYESAANIAARLSEPIPPGAMDASSANVSRSSLDWSVAPANEARPWFLTKEDVMALDDDRFVSIFGDIRSDAPTIGGRLFEHERSVVYAVEQGEWVPPYVRDQYKNVFSQEAEAAYLKRDALMDRVQRNVTAFPEDVLPRREAAKLGRIAQAKVDVVYEELRGALGDLKKRHQDIYTSRATNEQRRLADSIRAKAIKTGGDGDRQTLAGLFAKGIIPRAVPAKHLAEAKILQVLRRVEDDASKSDWGLRHGPIRRHLEEDLKLSFDTNIGSEIQNYYDFILRKYGGHNLEDAVAVYTMRPMNMLEEMNIVQLGPTARYASDLKTEAIRAGAAAVREGLMSPETFLIRIMDYWPDKYVQHEEAFREFVGEAAAKAADDVVRQQGGVTVEGKRIGGENFRKAEFKDMMRKLKIDIGLIEDPQWVFLQQYNRIWNDVKTAELFNRMKATTLTDTGAPLAVPPELSSRGVELTKRPTGVADDWVKLPGVSSDAGSWRRPFTGGNKGYGSLAGHWVPPELAYEINRLRNIPNLAMRMYNAYVRFWKVGHTAAQPTTSLVNWTSNASLADKVGMNPVLSESARATFEGTWDQAWQHEGFRFDEGLIGGLFGKDFVQIEASELISRKIGRVGAPDINIKTGWDEFAFAAADVFLRGKPFKGLLGMGKAGYSFAVRQYTFGDEFWKLWRYKQVRYLQEEFIRTRHLSKDMLGVFGSKGKALAILDVADEAKAIALAVENVFESGFHNYANVSRAIGWARTWFAPFMTFTYKMIPWMSKFNAERPFKAAFYRQFYQIMEQTTATMDGDVSSKERIEIEKARSSLPNWAQSQTVYEGENTVVGSDGKEHTAHSFYDAGRFTELSGFARRDESFGKDLWPDALEPNGMLWSMTGAFIFNRDPKDLSGRDLIRPGGGKEWGDYAKTIANAVRLSQLPDWFGGRGWDKVDAWYEGRPYHARGRKYSLTELITDGMGGSRRYDVMSNDRLERAYDAELKAANQPADDDEYTLKKQDVNAWHKIRNRRRANVKALYKKAVRERKIRTHQAIARDKDYREARAKLFGE